MKPLRQLLRQPLKTLSGIILVTLAVAILCVCLGQALTAYTMESKLESICTSVGLLTEKFLCTAYVDRYQNVEYWVTTDMPDDVAQWMYDMLEQYPDIVKGVNRPGLASAYIPELKADNFASYLQDLTGSELVADALSADRNFNGYTSAMLEITLTEIGSMEYGYVDDKYANSVSGVAVNLTGTIESVVGLQEGYTDPTGYTARMKLVVANPAAFDALELEVGQRYLVYAGDYTDLDWQLRVDISVNGYGLSNSNNNPQVDYFYAENWKPYTDEYIEGMGWLNLVEYTAGWYEYRQTMESGSSILRGIHLTNLDMLKFRSVQMTLADPGQQGNVPTISKLTGSVGDFLNSEDGKLWNTYLELSKINYSSFAVLGVDNLMATGDFALEKTTITAGRNFTDDELANGSKVCIISQEVAARSGLKVGDTITLNYFSSDENALYRYDIESGEGNTNPVAWEYGVNSEFLGQEEKYTIVGLYTREFSWQGNTSMYNFTVNTVFTPKNSVAVPMEYGEAGVLLSMVICNGALDNFEALAARDGYDGLFKTTDQGYETVKENLHDYATIAKQAAIIGVAVYAVIALLFLLLYPAMQGKTLKAMGTMGATRVEKLSYMMAMNWGMLVPGTVLGGILGAVLWTEVTASLVQSARVTLDLQLDLVVLLAIAGGQLLLTTVVAFVISLPMTRNKSLMNKQGLIKTFFQRLRRTPLAGWSIVTFAAIIAIVLCALQASNEKEYANYEIAVQQAPVTVTLADPVNNDPYNLGASGFVTDLFYEARFSAFTPLKYLKDLQYMTSLPLDSVNRYAADVLVQGFASQESLPESVQVTWFDDFDASIFQDDTMFLVVPEQMPVYDTSAAMDGIQILMQKDDAQEHMTVAGTYSGGNGSTIYSSANCIKRFCEMNGLKNSSMLNVSVEMYDLQNQNMIGITSQAAPPNLTAQRNCVITWFEGFDEQCLNSKEVMYLLVPEKVQLSDQDPDLPGIQVTLHFENLVQDGYYGYGAGQMAGQPKYRLREYDCEATVAGTYINSIDSRDIYCSFEPLITCGARVGRSTVLDYVSATMISNDQRQELREMCNEWFLDPDYPDVRPPKYRGYAVVINDETLENLRATLENSIAINEICMMLVFILSAGAGFFLGFLMIRSRKREIILMRTLGRANWGIYFSYALEQMLFILAGTALGGLLFKWQPLDRLLIFVGIYFVGLSAALILFLNSKLLTNIKEEE